MRVDSICSENYPISDCNVWNIGLKYLCYVLKNSGKTMWKKWVRLLVSLMTLAVDIVKGDAVINTKNLCSS